MKPGWKPHGLIAAFCGVLCLLSVSASANNHCLRSVLDTTPIDLNWGFDSTNPLRGQVITGYPDLAGSYSTQNVGLYSSFTGQQFLMTLSADITELSRQELAAAEGVIIEYRADLQVDANYAPFQPDNKFWRWYLQGPIEFTVVWELNPFGSEIGRAHV